MLEKPLDANAVKSAGFEFQNWAAFISDINRVAMQSIERKWVLEQSCRLARLSVCLSRGCRLTMAKRLIGSGYRGDHRKLSLIHISEPTRPY